MNKKIDLLKGNIFTSLTGLALPIMATALVQMAYNLTDMAWIGLVGSPAVAAVGAGGMYVWLSQGVVALAKMGGQVKVAHSLGRGDKEDAAVYASGALQMGLLFAFLYGAGTFFGAEPLIGFFGLNDASIVHNAQVYLKITCGLIVFSFLNSIITGIMTAMGDSRTPLFANVIGLVLNMVLDPVLIFGLGPIKGAGVAGAAIATVMAQAVVTMVFIAAMKKDRLLFHRVKVFHKVSWDHRKAIIKIGFPASVQNLIYTSISMVLTRFVTGFGDTAVAVLRVGGQIESISWMTADGFAAAINSFVGQNYGAGQYGRVKKGYFTAAGVMFVWGLFCSVLLIAFPEYIFGLFIHEAEVIPMGVRYLVILGFCQMFMCMELTTIGALSGLGKTLLCSVISVVFTSARIPFAMVFSSTALGLDGVWWAFTISSIIKGILFFLCFLVVSGKLPEDKCQTLMEEGFE
ncbi:MATE family efflux transporter [Lacrimispora saccharolytica]|uniref:Probable multidrug resistance protein NorM n=1 Tax=Lacrimispora saccharolytica (strain ATCC 35040 / DSM 2544 / NRCC 2533 / WM1) TaxID=610130 RepID=D9R736_LACSW|nr:MATE family efflux transporter [Lacrimispora saccharolytica]ADL05468.1 MATE efflux family protein [[Clostridium] saccharolyticum WM1]QRV20372.1 MATE family efflux transporter [Lacrimispora saccharolytica]